MSDLLEMERLRMQAEIDAGKQHDDRNKLGQFATPTPLALEILEHAKRLLKSKQVRFLDPAIGTGSFYSALIQKFDYKSIAEAKGFEIDPAFANAANELWGHSGLKVVTDDFTHQKGKNDFNLVISNPPYVRHHHLTAECKTRLRNQVSNELGLQVSGLTGLYCYFLLLCHQWMADDGIAGWLIPSEFMDVNYGAGIKKYLLEQVELIQIHRYDPATVQFDDALVSSAVVWFRKRKPKKNHKVKFTYGGSLKTPALERVMSDLTIDAKWTRYPEADHKVITQGETKLGDLIKIRRGLATGDNGFFIMSKQRIKELGLPMACFKPVLPPPRMLKESEVYADDHGIPLLDNAQFLLDTSLLMPELEAQYPALADYLKQGLETKVANGYLCAHREPWYAQERREAAPIVCTYMGRGTARSDNPFRFILNHSKAIATNVYLMLYPLPALQERLTKEPGLLKKLWEYLNAIPHETLRGEGRVYGGGLHKLEPKELANVPIRF